MACPPVRHTRCCSARPQGSPSTRGSHPPGSGESPRSGSQMTGLLPGMVRSKVSSGYSVSTLRPLDISSFRISISPSNLPHMLPQADLHSTAGLSAWSTTPAPPLSFYSFSRSTNIYCAPTTCQAPLGAGDAAVNETTQKSLPSWS